MRIPIKRVQLHGPVFVGGKNFKEKVELKDYTGLKMELDLKTDEFYLIWNGEVMRMTTNVAGTVPLDPKDFGIEAGKVTKAPEIVKTQGHAPMISNAQIDRAQVSTPHGLDRSKL